jgi:hypothetical protein
LGALFFLEKSKMVFLWVIADLQGFFAKVDVWAWCFCGEVVVKCVANVDKKMSVPGHRNMGQVLPVFFQKLIGSMEAIRICSKGVG